MGYLLYKELSYKLQGAFFAVYKEFGNAYKEVIYHNALIEELKNIDIYVESERHINVYYRDKKVGVYVPDLVIENSIIAEIKCKPRLTQEDIKQFWYYLKGSEFKVGYLVNFGSLGKVEYIRRVYDTARNKPERTFA